MFAANFNFGLAMLGPLLHVRYGSTTGSGKEGAIQAGADSRGGLTPLLPYLPGTVPFRPPWATAAWKGKSAAFVFSTLVCCFSSLRSRDCLSLRLSIRIQSLSSLAEGLRPSPIEYLRRRSTPSKRRITPILRRNALSHIRFFDFRLPIQQILELQARDKLSEEGDNTRYTCW